MFVNFSIPIFYRERIVILVITDASYYGELEEVDVRSAYAFDKDTGDDVPWKDVYDANYHYVDSKVKDHISEMEM